MVNWVCFVCRVYRVIASSEFIDQVKGTVKSQFLTLGMAHYKAQHESRPVLFGLGKRQRPKGKRSDITGRVSGVTGKTITLRLAQGERKI